MHNYMVKTSVLLFLFVLLLGCTKKVAPLDTSLLPTIQPTQTKLPFQTQKHTEWFEVESGVAVKHFPYTYNNGQYYYQVVRINPAVRNIQLAYNQSGKTIRDWMSEEQGLVMNAGFFKEGNASVGLLYIKGERLDNHRIRPEGTGLLQLEPNKVVIRDLSKQPLLENELFEQALQSYPMLISEGEVVIPQTAISQERRSAIGIDREGTVYLFSAEYQHLGLNEFAQQISRADLGIQELLNLDGGGSTGIGIRFGEYERVIDSQTVVPTVLIIQ